MSKTLEFTVRRETPTLDHYRRDWRPGPGVGLSGTWLAGVVEDAEGQQYLGLRGLDDFIPGMTHPVSPLCGFRALQRRMDAMPPHLFTEYATVDFFEPIQYAEADGKLTTTYGSGKIERSEAGCDWSDASGRWQMHGRTVSDIFIVHVPKQEGVESEVYYRHELQFAEGTINGVAVQGYTHLDYAYGPPGTIYSELPIPRQLQGMWVSWLHEYADGELGGGCFWQGKDGLDFGPGYVMRDGKTTVHKDITTELTLSEAGKLVGLKATVAGQVYEFVLDILGSPLHVFGSLTKSPTGKPVKRSWCWVEYAPGLMTPAMLDISVARMNLARGK